MCKYVKHLRICSSCQDEEVILISERPCPPARKSGVFGSCDKGIASGRNKSRHQCWKCKDPPVSVKGMAVMPVPVQGREIRLRR